MINHSSILLNYLSQLTPTTLREIAARQEHLEFAELALTDSEFVDASRSYIRAVNSAFEDFSNESMELIEKAISVHITP